MTGQAIRVRRVVWSIIIIDWATCSQNRTTGCQFFCPQSSSCHYFRCHRPTGQMAQSSLSRFQFRGKPLPCLSRCHSWVCHTAPSQYWQSSLSAPWWFFATWTRIEGTSFLPRAGFPWLNLVFPGSISFPFLISSFRFSFSRFVSHFLVSVSHFLVSVSCFSFPCSYF